MHGFPITRCKLTTIDPVSCTAPEGGRGGAGGYPVVPRLFPILQGIVGTGVPAVCLQDGSLFLDPWTLQYTCANWQDRLPHQLFLKI